MSVRLACQFHWLLWNDTEVSDKRVAYIFMVGDIRTGSAVNITHTILPCTVTA